MEQSGNYEFSCKIPLSEAKVSAINVFSARDEVEEWVS
jgi:hypothetical protein